MHLGEGEPPQRLHIGGRHSQGARGGSPLVALQPRRGRPSIALRGAARDGMDSDEGRPREGAGSGAQPTERLGWTRTDAGGARAPDPGPVPALPGGQPQHVRRLRTGAAVFAPHRVPGPFRVVHPSHAFARVQTGPRASGAKESAAEEREWAAGRGGLTRTRVTRMGQGMRCEERGRGLEFGGS
jgi:hypothetical protein